MAKIHQDSPSDVQNIKTIPNPFLDVSRIFVSTPSFSSLSPNGPFGSPLRPNKTLHKFETLRHSHARKTYKNMTNTAPCTLGSILKARKSFKFETFQEHGFRKMISPPQFSERLVQIWRYILAGNHPTTACHGAAAPRKKRIHIHLKAWHDNRYSNKIKQT
jgi:hypothetical protein